MKDLKKSAKEKTRDDDSKWKDMGKKLEKMATLAHNLSITGHPEPTPAPASHSAPTSSTCTCIHALQRCPRSGTPSYYWFTRSLYWQPWHFPYWNYKSCWLQS